MDFGNSTSVVRNTAIAINAYISCTALFDSTNIEYLTRRRIKLYRGGQGPHELSTTDLETLKRQGPSERSNESTYTGVNTIYSVGRLRISKTLSFPFPSAERCFLSLLHHHGLRVLTSWQRKNIFPPEGERTDSVRVSTGPASIAQI